MKHLIMDAANWWLTWAAFVGAAWGGLILTALAIVNRICRTQPAELVIADEAAHAADELPVPYWPADPIDARYRQARAMLDGCTWCKPKPEGHCSCTGSCGHKRCCAPRELFTAAERAFLAGRIQRMPR